ncbi:MAG: mechanosensitive ion channel family protein [Burkholderiaceae bacterium]
MNKQDTITKLTQWLGTWDALAFTAMRVAAILIIAWVALMVARRMINGLRQRVAARVNDAEFNKRAETLSRVARYLASVVISLIAVMLALSELGVSVAPILGAAGVVGLAVGFGAQSLVKDFVTGFFLLLENQIRQGDVVQVDGHTGTVEQITLRFVQLRDYEGSVHYVPNGQITTVVNMTRGFGNAVFEIGVAYREDLDEVMAVMQKVAATLRADPAFAPRIEDDLEIAGVDRWDDSAVVIRCRIRCVAQQQWGVKREYLKRLKIAFDQEGIEIPFPHITLYAGQDRQGKAPAFPLQQLTTG